MPYVFTYILMHVFKFLIFVFFDENNKTKSLTFPFYNKQHFSDRAIKITLSLEKKNQEYG